MNNFRRHGVEDESRKWLLAFRDVVRATDERSAILSFLPRCGAGHKAPLIIPKGPAASLLSGLCSFVFDYTVRQKLGGTSLSYFILKQAPVLPPSAYKPEHRAFIEPRVLELTYTAWDIAAFARDSGYSGPPFRWDDNRRFLLRCELDALYFHLYGIDREDAAYILDTFPIVRRKDESRWGEYRTRRVILEIYDAMAEAQQSGQPYATRLDPPPASPLVAHPPKPSTVIETPRT